jgi:ferric-dicitrate binding protein FerR (iron transport regulator)
MDENIRQLKAAYETAKKEHRAAFRRATWLERRLYDAPTEADYRAISAELEAQEEKLKLLGASVANLCAAYAAADIAQRPTW